MARMPNDFVDHNFRACTSADRAELRGHQCYVGCLSCGKSYQVE